MLSQMVYQKWDFGSSTPREECGSVTMVVFPVLYAMTFLMFRLLPPAQMCGQDRYLVLHPFSVGVCIICALSFSS